MALYDLIVNVKGEVLELDKIHLSKTNRLELKQLLKEFKYVNILKEYKLPVDNKLLLFGHTGCGKTSTARAIAKQLNKKIIILNLGGIVDSRLGQTAKNITEVFKKASRENAVLFLDEFDYIGKIRDYDNKDSGEMKRLVNTVIQLIDQIPNDTLLIAATNNSNIIDTALLRRFQLKLKFVKPTASQLDIYYDSLLVQYPKEFRDIERTYNLSYAEAKDIALRAIKNNIIRITEANELNTTEQDEPFN
jgi:SpoVK/Ycf46/Vps4 family AAA+-type ATPase